MTECFDDKYYVVSIYDLIFSKSILEYRVYINDNQNKTAFLNIDNQFNRIIVNILDILYIW